MLVRYYHGKKDEASSPIIELHGNSVTPADTGIVFKEKDRALI